MIKVGVLYGGDSPEYEVSLRSAETIIAHLDRQQFEIVPIHITKQLKWIVYDISPLSIPFSFSIPENFPLIYNRIAPQLPCDVIFSVLHGRFGEDGAIQGILEVMNMPYVGSGILSSSIGMNKVIAKQLVHYHQLSAIAPYIEYRVRSSKKLPDKVNAAIQQLGYPLFIKPVNAGSSIGISQVKQASELDQAINLASEYDSHLIIEKALIARELEIAVLENNQYGEPPLVSGVGEIITKHSFYSYEAKYSDQQGTLLKIPAPLTPSQLKILQTQAMGIFEALKMEGMARIDFFLEENTEKIYFNEINTLPGFTDISMYPRLWETAGKSLSALLTHLIQLALARHQRKIKLK